MSHLRAPAARADRREGGRHGRQVARPAPSLPETHIRPQLLRLAVLPPIAVALSGCAAVLFTVRSTGARPSLVLWGVLGGAVSVTLAGILIAAVAADRAAKTVSDRVGALRRSSARREAELRTLVEGLRRGEVPPGRGPRSGPPDDADDFELLAADLARAHDGAVTAVVQAAQLSSQAGSEQKLEVFVNLARRLQSLVHREISILDELENEIEDPDLLKGLFHVDHLATRIRRHAENLAVLGGAVSRRQWSNPVSMTEVLRSAIAEVEQYSRVKLVPPIDGTLRGHAVADVIHLLAELVENATVFSAPHTQVLLRANLVTSGLAVEVEDRGLGMPVAEQHRMNALLTDPDQVNVASLLADGRIGLFVVSQLAKRHGIHVRLQTNIYGGVQAVLVVPQALLGAAPGAVGAGADAPPRSPGQSRPGPAARHRGAPAEPRSGGDLGPRDGRGGAGANRNGRVMPSASGGGAGARGAVNGRGAVADAGAESAGGGPGRGGGASGVGGRESGSGGAGERGTGVTGGVEGAAGDGGRASGGGGSGPGGIGSAGGGNRAALNGVGSSPVGNGASPDGNWRSTDGNGVVPDGVALPVGGGGVVPDGVTPSTGGFAGGTDRNGPSAGGSAAGANQQGVSAGGKAAGADRTGLSSVGNAAGVEWTGSSGGGNAAGGNRNGLSAGGSAVGSDETRLSVDGHAVDANRTGVSAGGDGVGADRASAGDNRAMANGVGDGRGGATGQGARSGRPAPLPVRGAQARRPNPAEAVPGIRPGDRRLVAEHVVAPPTPRTGTVRGTMGKPQLPRRRAQEHIVPQLRGGPAPRQDAEYLGGHDPGLMAAFQRGISLAEAQQHLEAAPGEPEPAMPAAPPHTESARTDPSASSHTGPAHTESGHTMEASLPSSAHTASSHMESGALGPAHTAGGHMDSGALGSAHTAGGHMGSGALGSAHTASAHTASAHTASAPLDSTPPVAHAPMETYSGTGPSRTDSVAAPLESRPVPAPDPSAAFDLGEGTGRTAAAAPTTESADIDVTPMERPHISDVHGLGPDRTNPRHDGSAPAG
ncbi:ATP-binding protein [Streptomyces griseorubiginosus]|uniref:sensor histidine kinase n=1 Tax=Streptomyces griseorubiginosus TaxID=67304 RepID=UPI0036F18145